MRGSRQALPGGSRRGGSAARGPRGGGGRAPFSTRRGADSSAPAQPRSARPAAPLAPPPAPGRLANLRSATDRLPLLVCCVSLRGSGVELVVFPQRFSPRGAVPSQGAASSAEVTESLLRVPLRRAMGPLPLRRPGGGTQRPGRWQRWCRQQEERLLWNSEELPPGAHRGVAPAWFKRGRCYAALIRFNTSTGCLKARVCWGLCTPVSVIASINTRLR